MRTTILPLALAMAVFAGLAAGQARQPELRVDAPPDLAALRARLESPDPGRLAGIMELVGMEDPGPPIQVSLVPETSPVAAQFPQWVSGFARSAAGEVFIFAARSPSYPHSSVQDVLRHEVAHVLIARAAGNRPVPRWFNEGLAMAAERSWGFTDQTRFLYQLVLGSPAIFSEVDGLFAGNREDQDRAYALSGAFVRELIEQFGPSVAGEVLAHTRRGLSFDAAFEDATGVTVRQAESDFWRSQRVWTTWVPILTSSATVWMIVTLIAILAIRRRRQRDAEMRRRWDEEETEP
jgi:hypothetical protein